MKLATKTVAATTIALCLLNNQVTNDKINVCDTKVRTNIKKEVKKNNLDVNSDNKLQQNKIEEDKRRYKVVSRGGVRHYFTPQPEKYKLTAYNLWESSCNKSPNDKDFGITASGYSLKDKDITDRKIAVDTRKIKLGSKVYIEFNEENRYITLENGEKFDLNGVYTAVDTGGAIKGNKIDLYVGGRNKFSQKLALQIGVKYVNVYKLIKEE